ncbi:MAG: Sip1-related alpha-galactosidase, partial [Verrucomicrobiota bacterium]
MQNLPKELQKEIDCTHRTNKQADVQVVQFSSSIIKQKKGTLPLIFPEKKPWLTITRTMPFWFEPVHGKTLAEFSDSCESVLFLWRSASRRYELLLPLVNSTTRSYLVRIQGQLMLKVITDRKTKASSQPHLIMASGSDPFQLVHSAMQVASSELKTFRLREEKNTPKFIEGLGWCTWDAFYQEVNARGILRGLQSFKKGKLSPRFLIIDDGWQATKQFRVQGFAATSRKFPQGLSDVVEKAKHTYGVQMVGVW